MQIFLFITTTLSAYFRKKVDVYNGNGCASGQRLSSSQSWSIEKSVTDLDIHITDSRPGTPFELFQLNDNETNPTLGPAKAERFRGHHWNLK